MIIPDSKKVLEIIKDADDSACLIMYKMDLERNDEQDFQIQEETTINNQNQFPTSITKLGKFIFGGRPQSKGGMIYSKICVAHDSDREDLLSNIEAEFRDNEYRIFPQTIQHWDTKKIGFLSMFHPDGDMKSWRE